MPKIGPYSLATNVLLAPMAGVTDLPFRRLCRSFGAALAPSEMLSANPLLRDSGKSRLRRRHEGEGEPRSVQIAGGDPVQLAEAARLNVEEGAQIIDINMGCPAKKVLKQAAGSALLCDEALVERLLRAVVAAVDVPVTLKIRTGWSRERRNGVQIARIAEDCGIQALAVHGRTREDRFEGDAEYDTIAAIKAAVRIPVFANGDIDSPAKAQAVLAHTGADGVMIGRAAQGRPWLLRDIDRFLRLGEPPTPLPLAQRFDLLLAHLRELHAFYGDYLGVRHARKHVAWTLQDLEGAQAFRQFFNTLEQPWEQEEAIQGFRARSLSDKVLAA